MNSPLRSSGRGRPTDRSSPSPCRPLARSNGGTSSTIAACIAVVIIAWMSAACYRPP